MQKGTGEKENILLLANDGDQREALLAIFRGRDYHAVGTGSASDALKRLGEAATQLLLLDMKPPDMDGLEVLRQARDLRPDLDIILLSGRTCLHKALQGVNLGAFGYLTKPLDVEQTVLFVQRALEQRRLRHQLEQRQREIMASARLHIKILNERVQYLEQASVGEARLGAVYRVMVQAQGASTFEQIAQQILPLLLQEAGCQYASLTLVGPDGTLGQRADSFLGLAPTNVGARPGGLSEQIVRTGKREYVAETRTDPRANPELVAAGIRSYIGEPLKVGGRVEAILFLHSTTPDALKAEENFLDAIGSVTSLLLERIDLFKQIEIAQRQWQGTLDASGDGVVVIDKDRRILRANESFACLVGGTVETVIGEKVCRLVHGREDAIPDCPLAEVMALGTLQTRDVVEPYLGEKRLSVSVFPVPDAEGTPLCFVQVFRVKP